jgi:hypothetical protein
MCVKTLAQKNKMGKSNTTNSATSWVPSDFKQKDLDKAQCNDPEKSPILELLVIFLFASS